MMVGLKKERIEFLLSESTLSDNDKEIIAQLMKENNKAIESYIKDNAADIVGKSISGDLYRKGIKR